MEPTVPKNAPRSSSSPENRPAAVSAERLSDKELLARSRTLGASSLALRRRFLATLPEIHQRSILGSHYADIYEYAATVGGASRQQVAGVLALQRRLRAFPQIWALYETGRVGRSVLVRVPVELIQCAPRFWTEKLVKLGKRAIEKLVAGEREKLVAGEREKGAPTRPLRGVERAAGAVRPTLNRASEDSEGNRNLPGQGVGNDSGLHSPTPGGSSDPGGLPGHDATPDHTNAHAPRKTSAPLARDLNQALSRRQRARLEILRTERSERAGRKLPLIEVLGMLIDEAFLDSRPPGENPATPAERATFHQAAIETAAKAPSKSPLPRPVKRAVRIRSGGICEASFCQDPAEQFHHHIKVGVRRSRLPPRLAELPRHDPRCISHTCVTCHQLLHEGRVANPFEPAREWQLLAAHEPGSSDAVDRKVQDKRAAVRAARSGWSAGGP